MVWLQNDGLLGFLFKSIVFMGFQRASLFGGPFEARAVLKFHLLQLFCESPSRSPGFQNDGLLGFLFKSHFQRASLFGRPFEARVVLKFHLYSNSFVKARLEARDINTLKKQMFLPLNGAFLFFLFKLKHKNY